MPELLPLLKSTKDIKSAGTAAKPKGCQACQFRTAGDGFVYDFVPDSPKIGLLLDFPSGDEVLEQRAWAGKAGWGWRKRFIDPAGLGIDDVLIAHVLRCMPKWHKYPVGAVKRSAEIACRQYDDLRWGHGKPPRGGLIAWAPNIFVVTFAPRDAMMVPALGRLIIEDVKKASDKADEGYRPLVLMGTDVFEVLAPWAAGKGGAHSWRGHWWHGSWPWSDDFVPRPAFESATKRFK